MDPRGAVFNSPCKLELMSDLIVCVEWPRAGCLCHRMKIEGVVVGCTETGVGCFEITVLFFSGSDRCETAPAFTHLPN